MFINTEYKQPFMAWTLVMMKYWKYVVCEDPCSFDVLKSRQSWQKMWWRFVFYDILMSADMWFWCIVGRNVVFTQNECEIYYFWCFCFSRQKATTLCPVITNLVESQKKNVIPHSLSRINDSLMRGHTNVCGWQKKFLYWMHIKTFMLIPYSV